MPNTIDVMGDVACLKAILDRSITEYVDDEVTFIHTSSFRGCRELEVVDLPNVTSIGYDVFRECAKIRSLNLPKVSHFGSYILTENTSLEELSLPSATNFEPYSFRDCSALKRVNIPKATFISSYVFSGAPIEEMIVGTDNGGTVCTLFNAHLNKSTLAAIYVPDELVWDYQQATSWADYSTKIFGISTKET